MKILIVEDEEPILRLLADQFKKNGLEVLEAKEGETGLKLIGEHKPDLIILDLFMPKMDGVSMLKNLREAEKKEGVKEVPVIVITNFLTRGSYEEVMTYHPLDFIVKTDLKIENLIKTVRTQLSS